MTNSIVQVNVFQTVAPAPSTLQSTGAFISQGGTTSASGTLTLLTQLSSLTPLLAVPLALTSLTWTTGVVTATAAAAHNLTIGQTYYLTIAGAVPTGYNGTFACTITTTTAFTYPVASNPGTETTPGTYTPGSVSELTQMATTFFAQGVAQAIYVLELGVGSVTAGVASLTTWLTNNPLTVYDLVVPRSWDAAAAFLTLLASYEATTAKTYFWITTTTGTYTSYTAAMKCAVLWIEAATKTALEFDAAAGVWTPLHYNPSGTNKVPPYAFTYLFGVTPYPTVGNGTLLAQLKAAGVNVVSTGAEGGIANSIIKWGTMADLNPLNYWFSVDWAQIWIDLNLANAIINGSNNPINPLYLNQAGVNQLQSVAAATLRTGVTCGLFLGQVIQTRLDPITFAQNLDNGDYAGQLVINAIPYATYYNTNPSDFATGTYNGLSATVIPLRGFTSVTFNINVSNLVAPT